MKTVCQVRLLQVRREFDRGYSYLAPDAFTVKRGCVCAVPFGKANRPTFAIITSVSQTDASDVSNELKEILYTLDAPYSLSEELVSLCEYFSEHLLCSIGELARAALPSGLTLRTRSFVVLNETPATQPEFSSQAVSDLYLLLSQGAKVEIVDRNKNAAETLIKLHLARRSYLPENASNRKFIRVIKLACDPNNLADNAFTRFPLAKIEVYKKLLHYLSAVPTDGVPEKELCERFGVAKPALNNLEKRGLIAICAQEQYRATYQEKEEAAPLDPLNEEQTAAFNTISRKLKSKNGSATLLYGVTGSGKTRVMLHLIQKARESGKGVIYLVPEIGLTSRTAQELLRHFPDDVTILHSALSEGERHDAWVSLKTGKRCIVLGTRSAVFAPVQNLGLILIDEEQDHSYKADNSPRYHARDIARFRAVQEHAALLLASATPSIESFYKANRGTYTLCTLTQRATQMQLPSVEIVDLREDLRENPHALIGNHLKEAIHQTLTRGEQTLLFMNRRGYQYSPFCASCGHVITCPNCSVSLTLHNNRYPRVCCHYCGYSIPAPTKCPTCESEHLFFRGFGTQKLEEEIKEYFPEARILRMDADTVSQKFAHDDILDKFRKHEADILLGTQMIAKGHDFPDVTLVGVVMADSSLYLGDYRSTEDTFSLLTQVIGRAGRARVGGHAIIQTLNPEHEIFSLCASQSYDTFFEGEIALRKAVLYPPFCYLSAFTLTCDNEDILNQACESFNEQLATELEENPTVKLIVYGPLEPAVLRINNLYRKKFVIKHQNNKQTRAAFMRLLDWFHVEKPSNVSIHYDATPSQI